MKQYEDRELKPYEKVIYKREYSDDGLTYKDVPYIYDIDSIRFHDDVLPEEVRQQYIEHFDEPLNPMIEIKYRTKDDNEGVMLIHQNVFNKLSKSKMNKLLKLVGGKVS